MFWGLQMEANLRYSQQVPEGFRITKATLSTETPAAVAKSQDPTSKLVQVFVDQEGSEYAIATLKHGEIYDCSMDLRFAEGEDICFYLKGDGVVFLTGHNLYPEDSEESFNARDAFGSGSSSDDMSEDEDETDDTEDSENGPHIEDITELPNISKRNSIKAGDGTVAVKTVPAMKRVKNKGPQVEGDEDSDSADESSDDDASADEDDSEDDDLDEEDDSEESDHVEQKPYLKGKVAPGQKRSEGTANLKSLTPDPKKAKLENGTPSASKTNGTVKRVSEPAKAPQNAKNAALPQANESVKELVIEDVKVGTGPLAKKGKTVLVYYTGRLLNGKKFDSLTKGKPFEFKLGTSSVIKGWDVGLEGMKVGGKRRLLIPASMAYGKRRMGPIPADSALRFEVELKAVA